MGWTFPLPYLTSINVRLLWDGKSLRHAQIPMEGSESNPGNFQLTPKITPPPPRRHLPSSAPSGFRTLFHLWVHETICNPLRNKQLVSMVTPCDFLCDGSVSWGGGGFRPDNLFFLWVTFSSLNTFGAEAGIMSGTKWRRSDDWKKLLIFHFCWTLEWPNGRLSRVF